MSGNTIGKLFTVTTFGESHGPAMGGIVDGCPPGLPLAEADLQADVDRRRTGTSHFVSQRREADQVRILSGVFEGCTTGTPIGILIENTDARSRDYEKIKDRFRPGHADYTYQQKYGLRDYRGGGRASARETVMRVAAGAIARKYLAHRLGVRIHGYLTQVGSLRFEPVNPAFAYENPFFCPDPARLAELEARRIVQRLQRHDELNGGAVGVGDDAALAETLERCEVHLRNHERHVVAVAKLRSVVDDDATGCGGTRRVLARHLGAR